MTNNTSPSLAITDDIQAALATDAVVAVGVSGGKDSQACAIAVRNYLDSIGHKGPRVLVHADLGSIEWRSSLEVCETLAKQLGWELIVVRRPAGGMIERWESRWENNVRRYATLDCVKLILPWSTPRMRFCTSELKVSPITSALRKRFKRETIINASGIRREESPARSKMPVAKRLEKLCRKNVVGYTWNPIIEWKLGEVLSAISNEGLQLHDAYTRYGLSRVSCSFCIMSSLPDLLASAGCENNHDSYRRLVDLEATSTFGFQGARWLADIAPSLHSEDLARRIEQAKASAFVRQQAEASISESMLYTDGWPAYVPEPSEAKLLADVRLQVASAVGITVQYTTAKSIIRRYSDLIAKRKSRASFDDDEPRDSDGEIELTENQIRLNFGL